jgi:hypothetical protein
LMRWQTFSMSFYDFNFYGLFWGPLLCPNYSMWRGEQLLHPNSLHL